jgi:hypothetical protein
LGQIKDKGRKVMGKYYRILYVLLSATVLGMGCHNEAVTVKIEKLEFLEKSRTVKIGENAAVGIKITPESAKTAEKIHYAASGGGIIAINEALSSNDGVVFTATGGGSTVITARAQGIVDYLAVAVNGTADTGIPYITVTDNVLEVPVGTKKHFMSTLQNGAPNDYLSFVYSNKKNDIINYESANNTVVIEGLRPGSDIVTVRHPKAQYGVDVLVFTLESGEHAKYISGENVVFMEAGKDQPYYTRLVGVGESETGYSVYQVIDGNDIVTVTGSGESCYIKSKKEGVAKVRVTNRSAPYPFEFQIIVRGKEDPGYISMSSNFIILEDTAVRNIYAYYNGNVPSDINEKYTWRFEDDVHDIVEVIRYGNSFALKAIKNGNVKLIIENEYSVVKQEVLIQVQFEKVTYGEMLITTSQNVIYMEMGGVDVILKMKLIGGTQADKNSFEWAVEDSSVIEADVPDGHGTAYHRAMINYETVQEATAKITAKKTGTTYITVTNPKAPFSEVRVLVKVYPKGIFNGNTVSLGGLSLLKVKEGDTLDVNVQLAGSFQNSGELVWHLKDESVAGVSGAGLSGIITGLRTGTTELIVTGPNVLNEYRAIVVVHEEGREDTIPYIYTDRLQYKMYAGQTAHVHIYHPNIKDEVFSFSIVNTNTQAVYTVKHGNVIILNATEAGEAELVINTGIPLCNSVTISVSVELAEIDTERPYTITGNASAVTYVSGTVEYKATMAGAGESDKSKIVWTIDDSSVAFLEMANGTNVVLRGVRTGQTVLRAQSAKSANVKEVIVFVTATQNDAYSKIMLGLAKINYVLKEGESFFVKLVTNATENQKLQIRWQKSDADILEIEDNYDTAFITALEEGTCVITIDTRDSSHAMPLVLYVTVRSPVFDELQIGFPSSVTLVKGQSKIIKGNVLGGSIGSSDFIWNWEDDNVAQVIGNGLEATLWGRNAGQAFLTVSHYGFSKKILVLCVENESDLENIFYFTSDKSYIRIMKNEEARVNLLFGTNGFPEDEKKKIEWKEDLNNNVISLSGSGAGAKITGKNPGVARIIAGHDLVNKDVEIVVEVVESVTGSDEYYMLFPVVNKMVLWVPQTIPISLYKDDHLYTQGYNLLTAETEGKGIVQAELLNDTLRVMGCGEGREYITLSHPLAGQQRMLAVVYEGRIPDDADPVIYVDKTHCSVYEGKNVFIDLQIAGGDENARNGIMWANFDPQVISVDSSGKTRAKITGLSLGSTVIDILFNGNLAEKLYVSVAKGNVNTDIAVSTESIIIMALDTDTRHLTKVIGGGNVSEFEWSIKDEKIAEIYAFADQCILYPVGTGMTELTVGGYNYERKIIVVVVNTEKEKIETRCLNVDKRYYKLKKGESTVIYPYYKMVKPTVSANAPVLHYNSGVVGIESENGGIVINGKNEGIELISISNSQCENSIQIAVEVSNEISGGVIESASLVYMTTENNIILAEPNTYGIPVKIDVIGEYQGSNADFIWSKDSILTEWEVFGPVAFINTKEKTGEVNITVENNYCQHPLKIKVIIREDSPTADNPYVYADRTVYRLTLTDDVLRVNFKVNNLESVDYSRVVFNKIGNAADFTLNGSYFEVRPKTQGVSELEIGYPGAVPLKLFFIVSDNMENTAVYLTTAMNYVVVPKSKTKVIDVSLINHTELNSDNIKWSSSDFNTVTVVGTGRTVQIYGVAMGFAKLTVKHPASYNDLEIMVKVVDENDISNMAYLTTNDNIIETFVQNNSLQVTVEKIGGKIPELETVWSVDNPLIVSVMGSGGTAYLVPKKAGIAKLTVTERETEKLDIVVIVKEAKAGTEYIGTDDPVVQINPGTGSHTVQVRLIGGNDMDSQQFEWQIYSQFPSDYEAAKNGGKVISLFGMGDRATVSGNYAGTARIRVSHPKAQLPLYIAVQVSNFNTLSFNEREAVILNGEIYFAGIRVPNYENFTGKLEYSTDNPAVCVVTGSDKVALLQSQGVGKANITAVVRGTSLQASIEVSVIERDNFAEPNIIVPKTTYLLNPRERPFQIEAYLTGAGVTEEMRYGIKWSAALYNGSDQDTVLDAIGIYPSVVTEKPLYSGGETVKILQGTGPIIQVEVLNPLLPEGQTFGTKEIVIVVSQPEITSRTKTIYLRISEVSGIFTLSKSDITMEPQDIEDISCNILGGKDADYKEVVWFAETDSVGREIVKVMSDRGKNTRIYGINDGTVYVTALYRNEIAECRVQVKSNVYLKLQYDTFFTYPGARGGNNQLIEVEYEVRPYTTQIMWTPRGPTPDAEDPCAMVNPVLQDYSTGKGKITIDPLREGSFEIIGMMNGKVARMTVIVQNVYRLQISNRILRMQPGYTTEYNPEPNPGLYWDYDSNYHAKQVIVDNTHKIGGSIYLPFVICPPNHRLVFNQSAVKLMEKYGIDYEISPIVKNGEMEGRGIIKLTANREIPSGEYTHIDGIVLELDLRKPLEETAISPELYSSNSLYPNNCIYMTSQLPRQQTAFIPVFQRVYGKYSNPDSLKYKYYAGNSSTNNYIGPNYQKLTSETPPASAFDVNHAQWKLYPTGVLDEFNKATYQNSTSEYMPLTNKVPYIFNTAKGHSVSYDLEIGDGEEHYILLDRTHEGMFYEIEKANARAAVESLNKEFMKQTFYDDKSRRAPSAELVEINNITAILIKGGDDLLVYDRVLMKNRKKISFMYFNGNNNPSEKIYYKSEMTDLVNDKYWSGSTNANIGGRGALDYNLVKRFGIPLNNTTEKIVDYDEEFNDEWVLSPNVVSQIIYLRKSDPLHPIRVQYDYRNSGVYGQNGLEGISCMISLVGNEGGPVDFFGACDFFQNGCLYATKVGNNGLNYIKDSAYNSSTLKKTERTLPYNSNTVVSLINAVSGVSNPATVTHEEMLEYNPHYEDVFNGTLYIVSDFDLYEEEVLWYTGYSDGYYNIAFPDTVDKTVNFAIELSRKEYKWPNNGYAFLFYKLHDINWKAIGTNLFNFWYDARDNREGYFFNYNDGIRYYFHFYSGEKFMFMNNKSLFEGKPDFYNARSDNRGYYFPGTAGEIILRTALSNINYRAIIEGLRHNIAMGNVADREIINFAEKDYLSAAHFITEINGLSNVQKNTIYDLLSNDHGSVMVSSIEMNNKANTYNGSTLYVKRELEKGHNTVYNINKLEMDNPVSGYELHHGGWFYNGLSRRIITEDITFSENYAPVVTERTHPIYTSDTVPLVIKYKNSYNNQNTITFNVKHVIRSNHGLGASDQTAEWQDMKIVDQIYGIGNFSKLYGYFFVNKEYSDN